MARPEHPTLCISCHDSKSTIQNGLVTQPIPSNCHTYGGDWYNKKVLIWGEPSSENKKIAIAAQEKLSSLLTPKQPEPSVEVQPVKTTVIKQVRKFKVVKQEPIQRPTVKPLAIESTEAPLIDLDCRHIHLKKTYVSFLGREVYMDKDSDDAWEIMEGGGVGKKIEDDDV